MTYKRSIFDHVYGTLSLVVALFTWLNCRVFWTQDWPPHFSGGFPLPYLTGRERTIEFHWSAAFSNLLIAAFLFTLVLWFLKTRGAGVSFLGSLMVISLTAAFTWANTNAVLLLDLLLPQSRGSGSESLRWGFPLAYDGLGIGLGPHYWAMIVNIVLAFLLPAGLRKVSKVPRCSQLSTRIVMPVPVSKGHERAQLICWPRESQRSIEDAS
jgi:hypothetical protein